MRAGELRRVHPAAVLLAAGLRKVRIAWTAGLASLASIVLGRVLAAHGEALNKDSNPSGGFWVAWAAFFVALPFLDVAAFIATGIVLELRRDLRQYGARKKTLTPEQRTAADVVETAAIWGGAYPAHRVLREKIRDSQARASPSE
jgi:hypothetical protein